MALSPTDKFKTNHNHQGTYLLELRAYTRVSITTLFHKNKIKRKLVSSRYLVDETTSVQESVKGNYYYFRKVKSTKTILIKVPSGWNCEGIRECKRQLLHYFRRIKSKEFDCHQSSGWNYEGVREHQRQ